MKNIKLIIIAALLGLSFTGCSYVSDSIEGAIMDRASFTAYAYHNGTNVVVSWDKTDSSSEFAGIEIYRTSHQNDEYADYELVASRHFTTNLVTGNLALGSTEDCTVTDPATSGIYFYRVAFIHIDKDSNDNLYDASNPTLYDAHTDIDKISGYAKVVVP